MDRGGEGTYSSTTKPTIAATPAAITDVPGTFEGVKSVDPLHHTTTLTPPATVPPRVQTPDAAQMIYPASILPPCTIYFSWRKSVVVVSCGCELQVFVTRMAGIAIVGCVRVATLGGGHIVAKQ